MRHKSVRHILSFLVFVFSFISMKDVLATGPFDITIGQDTVFTEGNLKLSSGDASSDGTFAFARVEAGPNTNEKSDAYIGFSLGVVENAEALTSMAAKITVTYRYSLTVDFMDIIPWTEGGGGSADVQLVVAAIDPLSFDVNFVTVPDYYEESDTVTATTTQILNAGDVLSYSFDLDAHAQVYEGNFARAYVEVEIIEVNIDFIEDILAVITMTPEIPYLGKPITFDSSQSQGQDFVEWQWFIDDVPVANGPSMNRTFIETGTYRVKLWIRDQHGNEETDEKILTFQPTLKVSPQAANFHTNIYNHEYKETSPSFVPFLIENDVSANADLVFSDISFPLGGPFQIVSETCTYAPVIAGGSCVVNVKVTDQEKNGASNLQLSYNGSLSPRNIPVLHTVSSLEYDWEGELTKEGRKRFKDVVEGQQPTPPVVNIHDQINDYKGLEGKQWFFCSTSTYYSKYVPQCKRRCRDSLTDDRYFWNGTFYNDHERRNDHSISAIQDI